MTTAQTFLHEVLAFCARQQMAPSTFGLRAVNDGKLVSRLQDGKDIQVRTMERCREFMAAQPGEQIDKASG